MTYRIAFLDYMCVIACFMVIIVHSCEFFFIDWDNIGIRNMLWYFSGFIGYLVLAHYIRHHLQWNKTNWI